MRVHIVDFSGVRSLVGSTATAITSSWSEPDTQVADDIPQPNIAKLHSKEAPNANKLLTG